MSRQKEPTSVVIILIVVIILGMSGALVSSCSLGYIAAKSVVENSLNTVPCYGECERDSYGYSCDPYNYDNRDLDDAYEYEYGWDFDDIYEHQYGYDLDDIYDHDGRCDRDGDGICDRDCERNERSERNPSGKCPYTHS